MRVAWSTCSRRWAGTSMALLMAMRMISVGSKLPP